MEKLPNITLIFQCDDSLKK